MFVLFAATAIAAEPGVPALLRHVEELASRAAPAQGACLAPELAALRVLAGLEPGVEEARARALAADDAVHAEAEGRKLAVIATKAAAHAAVADACVAPAVAEVTTVTEPDGDVAVEWDPPLGDTTPCGSCL